MGRILAGKFGVNPTYPVSVAEGFFRKTLTQLSPPQILLQPSLVFIGTLAGELRAYRVSNGEPYTEFGRQGVVDLKEGLGDSHFTPSTPGHPT